jgi:hypothetical protein
MTFGASSESESIHYDMTPPQRERWNTSGTEHRPFDSSIGAFSDGRRPFTLHIRGYCRAHPPGTAVFGDSDMNGNPVQHTVQIEPMTPSEITSFQNAAQQDVYDIWNDKLYLVAPDITRGFVNLTQPIPPPLACRVEIEWVDSAQGAHLHILLLKATDMQGNVSTLPRSNCQLGGADWWADAFAFLGGSGNEVDMSMHTFQAGQQQLNAKHIEPGGCAQLQLDTRPPANGEVQTTCTQPQCGHTVLALYQTVFAHEFGHYLGLEHVCAGQGHVLNSAGEYGEGHGADAIRDIMGCGNTVTPRVGTIWQQQLQAHGYFPQYAWEPTTRTPPRERTRRTVRTRGWQ